MIRNSVDLSIVFNIFVAAHSAGQKAATNMQQLGGSEATVKKMACYWPMLKLALIGQCIREWPVAQLITGSTHYRLQYSSVYLEFSCTVDSGVNTLLNFKVFNPINALHVELIILCRTILIHLLIFQTCLLYTSPSPRDVEESRMPSSA